MEISGPVLQTYGYPFIALCLALGSLGAPLPASLVATIAGGLVASGELSPVPTLVTVLLACVGGDLGGYALGRFGGRQLADRHGRWWGLRPSHLKQLELLVDSWGGPMLILSRSILAVVASCVNFLAGVSRQQLGMFLAYDIAGRLIWTAGFVGLGYYLENTAEGAADVVSSLSGLVGLAGLAALVTVLSSRRRRRNPIPVRC
ncbi:MAG: DedA family protein [Chloroflexi bacterium]|nr:DedA family protein [Chloroflexota bacterium]